MLTAEVYGWRVFLHNELVGGFMFRIDAKKIHLTLKIKLFLSLTDLHSIQTKFTAILIISNFQKLFQ